MVFKTIISFISGLYRFYPVLPMGKTDCFTQFYPILPNWFYPMGKTTMPTLSNCAVAKQDVYAPPVRNLCKFLLLFKIKVIHISCHQVYDLALKSTIAFGGLAPSRPRENSAHSPSGFVRRKTNDWCYAPPSKNSGYAAVVSYRLILQTTVSE